MTKIKIDERINTVKGYANGKYYEFQPGQTAEVEPVVLSALLGSHVKFKMIEALPKKPKEPKEPKEPVK